MTKSVEIDLLIIGGGINGAGVARDAAGRGLSVILCEKDDLANHTSSASSKLIHGGLRYLEQMKFKLVHEALKEREILLQTAPYLVYPLVFVLPHDAHLRPVWMIRTGLFLYASLARRQSLQGTKRLNLLNAPEGTPLKEKFTLGFTYADCQVDDARLVVTNALGAKAKGAIVLTRTLCQSAVRENGRWKVHLYSQLTKRETIVFAKAIVNAAGAWVSHVLHNIAKVKSTSRIRLVKGSHIVVPKWYKGNHAYILQNPDKRVIFAIPYKNDFTLIGTTDVPFEGDPNKIHISEEETNYLIDSINYYFTKPLTVNDIRSSYAGVRALFDDKSEKAQKITREYHLELNNDNGKMPILSIFGGKLTTYRSLAERVLSKLKPYFPKMGSAWTASTPLPGGDLRGDFNQFLSAMKEKYTWLPKELLFHYASHYGKLMNCLLESATSINDLGEHFGGGLYRKEVDYLIKNEWAKTTEDILWRRTKWGLILSDQEINQLEAFLNDAEQ
ncbi:glycerol-3-phosphate dehydrogenase [Coxiella burnetii]|uniref:glycerol-3-phosphate dehydrogenase n=1 Tax=Coxiella burnetii TaxID=777 RepID=UPI000183D0F4|nr:glycerol-3-phosphate dehydrogenase [Coxiella burnetii]ACJ20133.1 glycerol-3-phosphate dehydrogenase [Coxiella burnetii CbuK_Q154]EAX33070.2 glycerol-3-phosphate dehydrogenase [Coxiella burnetii 'MSU Goat Q177']UYK70524.1 glycerol-3-phosphate dehydrogenase [Coxiella burnetii]